jgi:membrane-bound lytic murein transglycosylase B
MTEETDGLKTWFFIAPIAGKNTNILLFLFRILPALLPVIAASPAAASFSSCVAGLQEAAARAGVSRSVSSRALDIAQPDEKVLSLSEVQRPFVTGIQRLLRRNAVK